MDFGLQHGLPGCELPTEWGELLAKQARMLEALLTRVTQTVSRASARPHRTQGEMQRLAHILTQHEHDLTTLAEQYVGFERETAGFEPVATDAQQRQVLDQVTAALHANLRMARQYLMALRHTIESGEKRP